MIRRVLCVLLLVSVQLENGLTLNSKLQVVRNSLQNAILNLDAITGHESSINTEVLTGLGRPSSCAELLFSGHTKSGVYTVFPRPWFKTSPFNVYCDMETDGGGWTVFQRRDDFGEPREDFYRTWKEYAKGFGNLTKEFWLGNDPLFVLTNQDHVTLRIDLEDFENEERYVTYDEFQIADKENDYRVRIGKCKGETGDSLDFHNNVFVTRDKNDVNSCAANYKGGWWYTKCHTANLNGRYLKGNHTTHADGVNWKGWHGYNYSLKKSEMKVRPTHFFRCDDRIVTRS